jgi:GNAT superfamily N-acetyltransferase
MALAASGVVVRQMSAEEVAGLRPASFDVAPIFERQGVYGGLQGALLVAEVGGEVMGCAALRYEAAGGEKGTMHVDQFVVLPRARGRGVGSKLMKGVLGHAKGLGIRVVRAEMPGWCPEWRAFYSRFGFVMTEVGEAGTSMVPVELRMEG